jgi:DNA-directed RNA polymerase sigma subunit (sigma70/sigma32)
MLSLPDVISEQELERLLGFVFGTPYEPPTDPNDPVLIKLHERVLKYSNRSELLKLFDVLNPRQTTIVILRVGIGCDPLILREIGQRLNISTSWVFQIESKAFAIMRHNKYSTE